MWRGLIILEAGFEILSPLVKALLPQPSLKCHWQPAIVQADV